VPRVELGGIAVAAVHAPRGVELTIAASPRPDVRIEGIEVSAYTVPTDSPESDGTFEWDETTVVVVEVAAGNARGLGLSYTGESAARVVERRLAPRIIGRDALDVPAAWGAMVAAVRNVGLPGIAATAISAVDVALWDLKARLLELPLVRLLGAARESVPVYGSGGFTSYDTSALKEQVVAWADAGIDQVKIKVGRTGREDVGRVRAARSAVGPDVGLLVDANGAYAAKQALVLAQEFARYGVSWFEEPVPSDDLEGLCLLRKRAPAGVEIAAGEYGYDARYFRRMLAVGAVDVLQADASRCLGLTGFLSASAVADAFAVPLSAHAAPSIHLHACCAVPNVRHIEWFHDHVRIERLLLDGVVEPERGELHPDLSRPGLGLEFKRVDAEQYLVCRASAGSGDGSGSNGWVGFDTP
jgi:L-alanine-DL-glutamate epimerase-like enolase superfamily enzyme